MYSRLPSFVLGFHGCDESVAGAVLRGKRSLLPSRNPYDWLGEGAYFWENNPARAIEYAIDLKERPRTKGPKIKHPAVLGAVVDLGYCLNLLDSKFIRMVADGYRHLVAASQKAGLELPRNRRMGANNEFLLRDLDCAVINWVHALRQENGLTQFDSVRAVFAEGEPLFRDSGFLDRNHIQICIRNPRCIKGYFRPLADTDEIIL